MSRETSSSKAIFRTATKVSAWVRPCVRLSVKSLFFLEKKKRFPVEEQAVAELFLERKPERVSASVRPSVRL